VFDNKNWKIINFSYVTLLKTLTSVYNVHNNNITIYSHNDVNLSKINYI